MTNRGVALAVGAILVLVAILFGSGLIDEQNQRRAAREKNAAADARDAVMKAAIPAAIAESRRHLAGGSIPEAERAIVKLGEQSDPGLVELRAEIARAKRRATIAQVELIFKDGDSFRAAEMLERLVREGDAEAIALNQRIAPVLARDKAKLAADIKATKKKAGVTLGMTPQDVYDSSWGRPTHVNRTTTSNGSREQWVYGGRDYLYFENGKLTGIQN